jgi:hypothetical protein
VIGPPEKRTVLWAFASEARWCFAVVSRAGESPSSVETVSGLYLESYD